MFGQSLVRATRLVRNVRYFRSNGGLRDTKDVSTPASSVPKPSPPVDTEHVLGAKMHVCNNFDKWILVWTKKFPHKDQVPAKVTLELLHKAQSQARVRVANLMIVVTIIGCVWAVVTGKQEAKAGKSLSQRNEDWHAEINREYKASLAAQPKTT